MLENLEDARAVKAERRRYLRELRAGRYYTYLVLQEPPSCIRTMTMMDFILNVPRREQWVWNEAMHEIGVRPAARVGDLPRWQRVAFTAILVERGL